MQSTGPDMAAADPGPAAAPTPHAALPPASTADPPAATQAAEAPAPDGLQLEIPAANITVVRTAGELQRAALAGAQDIEIRAHLDLRSLELAANPLIHGNETAINRKRLALLYASPPLRSIRGNCSEADAEAALGLPSGTFPNLLPLRPRQCLLVMEQTWLMVNSGKIWVDNLYLKVSRRRVQPRFAFITAGALNGEMQWPAVEGSYVYVTATTFHGEHRGSARAITCEVTGVAIYAWGCIFTDWAGFLSPITLNFQSMATVRDSVFRNMHLQVEIVDVSYEGMVNFQNVSFVNVSLEHGAIVSITSNDYNQAIGFYIMYYAEDDANYDMPLSSVPPGHRTVFGEQLAVLNSTMSDCVYLLRESRGAADVLPGCPYKAEEARNRTIDRGFSGTSDRESTGVPFTSDYSDYMYGEYPAAPVIGPAMDYTPQPGLGPSQSAEFDYGLSSLESHTLSGQLTDYEVINDPWLRSQVVTNDDHVWLKRTQEVLPKLAQSPGWPPFRPPLPPPHEQTSLRPDPVTPTRATAASMAGLLSEQTPPTPPASGFSGQRVNVLAILLIVAAEVLLAAVLLWLWISKGSRLLRWCTRRRSMHAKVQHDRQLQLATTLKPIHKDPDYWKRATSHAARHHEHGGSPPHGSKHHASRGTTSGGDSHRDGSVISNGLDVPPASALNPDFEYALPLHLALFAQPSSSLALTGYTEPGSTVVVAPYTVSPTQAAAASTPTHASDEQTRDGGSAVLPGVSLPGSAVNTSSGGDEDNRVSWQGEVQHNPATRMGGDGVLTPKESEQHHDGCASPPAADAVEGGKEIRQGLQCDALAQAADMNKQKPDVATRVLARRLQRQLDSFTASDLFLGRFEMLGRGQRRRGGQAVVQFAQSRQDRCEFAIKFFLDWQAFVTEAALYAAAFPHLRRTVSPEVAAVADAPAGSGAATPVLMSEAVARFLPQVEAVCDGAAGGLEDPWGRPLPPCIVMEQGESLQDLCDRAEPDVFTVFSVLSNVSRRLADMHAAGFVHRDLKPANVMWLPRQNRWTVIDFGCVARVGEEAPLSFSLAYAAPEVAVAYRGRQQSIEAQPALDAWSLGVTAFELLTGAPAFDLVALGRSAVLSMLEGATPLPWEGELSHGLQRKLGVLGRPVLQLLQREPARRSTLEVFHVSCGHIFAQSTTTSQT